MKIGIVGLGLIGGSMGRAILKKTAHSVYGYDNNKEVCEMAKAIYAMNYQLLNENINEIDVLFIALYPSAVADYLAEYCPKLKDGAIIVDLCGNKRKVCAIMESYGKKFPKLNFIGGHPMAGREFVGLKHSKATLFEKASMILVNINAKIEKALMIKELATELGFSRVVITTAEHHDKVIAYTSQLAHIVSSSYINNETSSEFLGFSAGSFRDMTRVARMSSEMWTELVQENKDNVISEIDNFISTMNQFKQSLIDSDFSKTRELFESGNKKKLEAEKKKNLAVE